MNEIEKASIIEQATQFALNNSSFARSQGFKYNNIFSTDLYHYVNFWYLNYDICPASFTVVIPIAGGEPYFDVMI